ncbi:MAG: hypothetical protein HRS57_02225 [Mycoplasmataceae bacterium]|nr:hypothetical protein [Mycoplasmataceae bacterium]
MKIDLFNSLIPLDKIIILNQKKLDLDSTEVNLLLSIYYLDSVDTNFESLRDFMNVEDKDFDKALLSLSKRKYITTDSNLKSTINISNLVTSIKSKIVDNLISTSVSNYILELQDILLDDLMPEESKMFTSWLSGKYSKQIIASLNDLKRRGEKLKNFNHFSEEIRIILEAEIKNSRSDDSINFNWLDN